MKTWWLVIALYFITSPFGYSQSPIRKVTTIDEVSGRSDVRVIIVGDSLPELHHTLSPDEFKGASLIFACGNRFPADSGRSVVLFAGQPLEPFGVEGAYAEVTLDGAPAVKLDMAILDYGDAIVVPTGGRSTRHLAFMGTRDHPYYSGDLVRQLLSASQAVVRYRVIGNMEWRVTSFRLEGLKAELMTVSECRWPT